MSIARHPLIMFGTKPATGGSFLLDTYTGATAAYSLRQLKTGVTSVVRVRRSSDNTESDFTTAQITDGTLLTWVGAGNDGFVTKWYDQSGNSKDITQTTTTLQAKIVIAGSLSLTNGNPSLDFGSTGSVHYVFPSEVDVVSAYLVNRATDNTTALVCKLLSNSTVDSYVTNYGAFAGNYLAGSFSDTNVINGSNYLNNILTNLVITKRLLTQGLIDMHHLATVKVDLLSKGRTATNRSWYGEYQEVILYGTNNMADRSAIAMDINTHYGIY